VEDPELQMAATGGALTQPEPPAAAAPQPLRKAGRTFSSANQAAMHKVIQALANMLQSSGDQTAAAVLKCYGAPDQEDPTQPKTAAAALPLDETVLQKALDGSPMLGQMSAALQKMTQTVADLTSRLEKYESQPASGGPVLRQVAGKTLPLGVSTETVKPGEPEMTQASLADLRKAVALEPNPMIRAGLISQLKEAEAAFQARS
jgi:hypothetical protein